MLDDPNEVGALFPRIARLSPMNPKRIDRAGQIICGRCGEARVVDAECKFYDPNASVLLHLECRECSSESVLLWYVHSDGMRKREATVLVSRFPESSFGPHAPPGVAYYCDQARRCRSVGAHSAAVAMFRGAVEQVLTDKGYTEQMLGPKLAALEVDLKKGDPKAAWAKDLHTDLMRHLKDLGNAGVHGDVTVQAQYGCRIGGGHRGRGSRSAASRVRRAPREDELPGRSQGEGRAGQEVGKPSRLRPRGVVAVAQSR